MLFLAIKGITSICDDMLIFGYSTSNKQSIMLRRLVTVFPAPEWNLTCLE